MGAGASVDLPTVEIAVKTLSNLESDSNAILAALGVIDKADTKENKQRLICPEVLKAFTFVLKSGNPDVLNKACSILYNFSGELPSRTLMGSADTALMEALVPVIKNEKGSARSDAINTCYNLARVTAVESRMCDKKLGLLEALTSVIISDTGIAREEALGCIWNVSITGSNKTAIAKKELGLLDEMLKIVRNDNAANNKAKYFALGALGNLVYSTSVCDTLIASSFHDAVLPLCGKPPEDVSKRSFRMLMMYCSYEPAAKAVKRSVGAVDTMLQFINRDSIEGLTSLLTVFFLTGRDEANSGNQLLHRRPNAIEELVKVLSYTLEGNGGKDHNFGFFNLKILLEAFKCLSLSDSNKAEMCRSATILPTLLIIMNMFINDTGRIKPVRSDLGGDVGGGRKDTPNLLLTIEILLQLSFNFESSSEMRDKFFYERLEIPAKLRKIIELAPSSSIKGEELEYANLLLNKLIKVDTIPAPLAPIASSAAASVKAEVVPTVPSTKGGNKHVFVSYAWKANKPLVVRLCRELRQLNIEVWRDEEGSKYVPAMSGNTDDIMAAAIEKSSYAIVCVSRDYKDSPNCRMEGKYINDLNKRNKLRIIYVMMDENYHTRSTPEYVDGWLAFMVGDSLWYPLWNEGNVASSTTSIRTLLDSSVLSSSESNPPAGPIPSISQPVMAAPVPVPLPVQDNPLEEAWKLLSNSAFAVNPDELTRKLDELGVTEFADLQYLAKPDVEGLGNLLKPAKKGKFFTLFPSI